MSYFARHEVDKQGSTWDDYGKGRQAWDGWGGDAGRAWAERTLRQIERERTREDKKMDKKLDSPHRQPQPQQPPEVGDKILTGAEHKADATLEEIEAQHMEIGAAIQSLDNRVTALEEDRADYHDPEDDDDDERRRLRGQPEMAADSAWADRTRGDDAPEGLQRVWRMDYISLPTAQAITTRDGFLEIKGAVVARAGVLDYRLADGTTYKELRDPDVIFARSALDSYNGRPLLEGAHPVDAQGRPTFVTGDNISTWVPVGSVRNMRPSMAVNPDTAADDFPQEYQVTRADLLIWGRQDEESGVNVTIERIKSGELREFSVGYETMIDPTPGTFDGVAYDARQVADVGNHIALVSRGRAGSVTRFRMDSDENVLTNARRYAVRFDKCDTYAHNSREGRGRRVDSKHERRADNMAQITLNGVQGEIDALLVPMVHETQKELAASQKLAADLTTQVSELTQRADEADAKLADALAEQASQSATATEALEGVKAKADSLDSELSEAHATIAKLNEELGAEKAKLGASEAQVAELKAQVEAAQARGDAQVDIDAAVQARIELIDDARQYLPADYDFKGKADLTIKADAVAHVTKRSDIDDSQVEGAYKVLEMLKGRDNTSEVAEATRPASDKVAPFRMTADSKPRITADEARKHFLNGHRTDHATGRNGFSR